jgi:hypothetical protein
MDDSRTPEPEAGPSVKSRTRSLAAAWPAQAPGVARPSFTEGQTDAPASQRGFLNNGPHGAHATRPDLLVGESPWPSERHDEGTERLCLNGRLSGFKGRDLPISLVRHRCRSRRRRVGQK